VSLDLASFNVVAQSREFLSDVVREHVDILIANEEEARAYTGPPIGGRFSRALAVMFRSRPSSSARRAA